MITIIPKPYPVRIKRQRTMAARWLRKFNFNQETFLVITEEFPLGENMHVHIEDSAKRSLWVKRSRLERIGRKPDASKKEEKQKESAVELEASAA